MTTTRRTLLAGLGLAALSLGGLWCVEDVAAGKPASTPRVIAYYHRKVGSGVSDISVMDASGGNKAVVTTNNQFPPRWSPDGKRLLFVRSINGIDTLVHCAADGSDERAIVTETQVQTFILSSSLHDSAGPNFEDYDWGPNGQWVAFGFHVGYVSSSVGVRLFQVRIADGALIQLTDDIYPVDGSRFSDPSYYYRDHDWHYGVRWSTALDVIAYVDSYAMYHPYDDTISQEVHELWVIDPVTLQRRQITGPDFSPPIAFQPSWSNGGDPSTGQSRLLIQAGPNVLILDVDLDAADPIVGTQQVSIPGHELLWPEWSPDDSKLVLIWGPPGTAQIGTFDLASGATKVLLKVNTSTERVSGPDWRAAP